MPDHRSSFYGEKAISLEKGREISVCLDLSEAFNVAFHKILTDRWTE